MHRHLVSAANECTSSGGALTLVPGRRLSVADIIHGAQFAAPGDTYGALTTQEQASATVHACLAAGIRWFDTAPLYTDCASPLHSRCALVLLSGVPLPWTRRPMAAAEDKLGHALMTATADSCGGAVVQHLSDKIVVGGTEVHVITKTGRLVRAH